MEPKNSEFIDGFNSGYLIAAHEDKLAEVFSKGLSGTSDFLDGFTAGKNQFDMEKVKGQLLSIDNLRNKSKRREQGLDRG